MRSLTPPLSLTPPTHLSDGQIKHVATVKSDDRQGRHEQSHQRQVELCACIMCAVFECAAGERDDAGPGVLLPR
jgi:hypothetical protein